MAAIDAYKELISRVAPFIKERGFVKRAEKFYLRQENNWGLIDFKKVEAVLWRR